MHFTSGGCYLPQPLSAGDATNSLTVTPPAGHSFNIGTSVPPNFSFTGFTSEKMNARGQAMGVFGRGNVAAVTDAIVEVLRR